MSDIDISALKGTPARLAKLVVEYSTHEHEGFNWLKSTRELIAAELGVNEKTVRRALEKYPEIFRYLDYWDKEDGNHVLIRVGTGYCESDHVAVLRKIWVHRLVYYNAALEKSLQFTLDNPSSLGIESGQELEKALKRHKDRVKKAHEGAANLGKLKAGQRISLSVSPKTLGLLRGLVQKFGGEDARAVLDCFMTPNGWSTFASNCKTEGRTNYYYHWPNIPLILKNPDLALETLLQVLQEGGKISIAESNVLLKKISQFQSVAAVW